MNKLNYSEIMFIVTALEYFSIRETEVMKKNQDYFSEKDILQFRHSVLELTNKILKIKEGEEDHGILCNRKGIFRLFK